MGDWIKLDKNNRDTYPRFCNWNKNNGWRSHWETDRVLCAIKAPLANGEVRYLVKEGKGTAEDVGIDSKPINLDCTVWRVPGSQNDVVAWMPLPEYNEEPKK